MQYINSIKTWCKKKTKEDPNRAEKRRVDNILKKQRKSAADEINLEWRFVFGIAPPRKRKEIMCIKDITLRNVWMEDLYIFNQIIKYRLDEVFHSADKYVLVYRPPSSPFTMKISLSDRRLQEEAVRTISALNRKQRRNLLFHFVPADQAMPMHGVKVHKASLVTYRGRTDVLNKLCDMYISGRLPLSDFNATMDGGYEGWKQTLYNFLPPDEQVFHTYLQRPSVKKVVKSDERKYMDDDITLQDYEDLKYPERKKIRDMEALEYPRPYEAGDCIVCTCRDGLIKCLQCPNLVCKSCIISEFLNPDTSSGSFMLLHRKFCMRFGHVPDVPVIPEPTPGVLNTLRLTGKKHAEEVLLKGQHDTDNEDDGLGNGDGTDTDVDVDPIALRKEEAARRYAEAIAQMRAVIEKGKHRIKKVVKNATEYQLIIDDTKRTQQMRDRAKRLLEEEIAQYQNNIKPKLDSVHESWATADPELVKTDKSLQKDYDAFSSSCAKLERLVVCESYAAYEELEVELAEIAARSKQRDIEDSLRL